MTTRGKAKRAARAVTIGNKVAPARFLAFLVLLPLLFAALLRGGLARDWHDALALAFDGAALVFLLSLVPILRAGDTKSIRQRAAENDANRILVLVFTTLLTIVVMAAIAGEMPEAQKGSVWALVKLVGTLTLIWTFATAIYALHYAHAFYSRSSEDGGDTGGLEFPRTKHPSYADFFYFAFNVAMAFSTSDVDVTLSSFRRVVMLQSFVAFVFNIGVIAFTLNTMAGAN